MILNQPAIDNGKKFEWGNISEDYARFRDIYPPEFYSRITEKGICTRGQKILDIGTGTGVLPFNLYKYGGDFTGIDIDDNQIAQARKMAAELKMNINFEVSSAETADYPCNTFDVITACQCYIYFDYEKAAPRFAEMLKDSGRLVLLWMAWLPFEDKIAMESEKLILKYNPDWTGCHARIAPIEVPDAVYRYFDRDFSEEYTLPVHFTRESWHGRMKACRGTGASMSAEVLEKWENEHKAFLETQPEEFDVAHYAGVLILKKK